MNRLEKKVVLMSVLVTSALSATIDGVRSPINSLWGHMHWPLKDVTETWWYEAMDVDKEESRWDFQKWSSLFTRSASKAFQSKNQCEPCDSGKNTTKTKKLGVIVFGQESFKVEQSLAGGILNSPLLLSSTDPFIASAFITPDFDYSERGVNWGGRAEYQIDEDGRWAVGFAAHIPFKVVEVVPNEPDDIEETLQDMFKTDVIQANASGGSGTEVMDAIDVTIRLDLLASLALDETNPLLNLTTDDRLKIGPNEITFVSAPIQATDSAAGFFLYKDSGTVPSIPYRKNINQVTGILAGNGLGGVDGNVLAAVRGEGYTTLLNTNRSAQSNLWLVLRQDESDPTGKELTVQATAVAQRILYNVQLADLSNRSAVEYLRLKGLDLTAHERVVGLGDLDMGVYVRYNSDCDWHAKGAFGVLAPTGTKRKDKNGLRVYQFQTGNNRHWELSACFGGGWMPRDWISLCLGASVHHAFPRTEQMPASFTGATVRNLGPLVEGKISWTYFTAHFNVGLFHPYNSDLGCVIGYQLFAKLKDHVSFENGTSVDFVGQVNQVLDASVAERDTNAMLHKFRAEIFHRWNFFELFAGVSQAVAGKNAMQETEAHLGCSIYF